MYSKQCQWISFTNKLSQTFLQTFTSESDFFMRKVTKLTEKRVLPSARYVSGNRGKIGGSITTPRRVYSRCRPILLVIMILKESTSTL